MKALEILQKELDKHLINVHKSNIAFEKGIYDNATNQMHVNNNQVFIDDLNEAILILTKYMKQ